MQANIKNCQINENCFIYNAVLEIGVDSDIVLPDYCGDIERILKCTLSPRISSKRAEEGKITISGTAFMRLVYLTPEGKISSFETQIPFSKSAELKDDCQNASVRVKIKTDYVGCQPMSARRFELRATLFAKTQVKCIKELCIASDIEGEKVQKRMQSVPMIIPILTASESFSVSEEYELNESEITSVVKMNANASIQDSKIISGKIIIKGDIELSISYMCADDSQPKSISYSLPINQVMSAAGAEDGDILRASLNIIKLSAEPGSRGNSTNLNVTVLLEIEADVLRQSEVSSVTDAYVIGRKSNCNKKEISVLNLYEKLLKPYTFFAKAKEGEVLDAFVNLKNENFYINEQGEVFANLNAEISFLVCKDDSLMISEKTENIEFPLGASSEFRGAVCDGDVSLCEVKINKSKNEAEIKICAEVSITKQRRLEAVDSIEVLDEKIEKRDDKTALTVYFASPGEDAFYIAKRYNTSVSEVIEQNSLENSQINKECVILIPMV